MRFHPLRAPNHHALARKTWSSTQLSALCWFYFVVTSVGSMIPADSSNSTALGFSNATDSITLDTLQGPFPYVFPDLAHDPADRFPMPHCNGMVLEEATIDELQEAMKRGQLTSVAIVMCYLQRVYQTDEYIKYAALLSSIKASCDWIGRLFSTTF